MASPDDEDRKQFRLREDPEQDPKHGHSLTDWTREPDLQRLKGDFEASKPFHDTMVTRINEWNDQMYVRGNAAPKKMKNRSQVQPKLIKKQAEWRYSALSEPFLSSDKLFTVNPVTFEDAEAAKQNELVLNWQFRTKINRVKFIDDYVRSAVDDGTVFVKVGWERRTEQVTKEVPTYDHFPITSQEEADALNQGIEFSQNNRREYEAKASDEIKAAVDFFHETNEMTVAKPTGQMVSRKEEIVLMNKPILEIMDPQNVFVDPSCQGDIRKALFIIVSFETNRASLQGDKKKYKNLDKVNWESNSPIYEYDHKTNTPVDFNFKDKARRKVIAYEYWGFYDIRGDNTLVPIVATWIGDTIIRMEESPFSDGELPFCMATYSPVKRELMGEPDAPVLEDNQKILGAVMRGAIDLMGRSANSQRGIQKGMLDAVNRIRYDRGDDYEFNPTTHPTQGVMEHKYPDLPNSVMQMINLQNFEAESMTGVKSFSGGISGESYGQVVAGIRGALDAAAKREMGILRRLSKCIVDIGRKIIAMNGLFLSEGEVIRVTNEEFITVSPEELLGDFDLEVDIATAEVDNIKAQDLAFMLQTMGPNMDPKISMALLSEIAALKRMPKLSKQLAVWEPPPPDPIEQRLKAAEAAKMEAEAMSIQKEIERMDSEINKNNALADKARAEADLASLNFVEQETGTKHERDMQKQREQSRGNQNLEVTKALLKPRKQANGGESKPDIEAGIGFNSVSDRLAEETDSRPEPIRPNPDPGFLPIS